MLSYFPYVLLLSLGKSTRSVYMIGERKMLQLSDRVAKRRSDLLNDTLNQILVAFARRQDQITRCFLPSSGIECKELAEVFLSSEEKRFLTEQMELRGFTVSFIDQFTPAFKGRSYATPEKRCTSMIVVSCDCSKEFTPSQAL